MDEGMTVAPKAKGFLVYAMVALLVIIVLGTYLYMRSSASEQNPLKNYFTPLYLTVGIDGTMAWYGYEKGTLAQHTAPVPGAVTGLARALSATYFGIVPFSRTASSTIYKFENGSYTKVYEAKGFIGQISVSSDAAFIGVTGLGSNGRSVAVVDASAGTATLLGESLFPPQFLSDGSAHAVLYAAGTSLMARVFDKGQWQNPIKVYTSTGATLAAFASDGAKEFAFVEPDHRKIEKWEVASFSPFTAAMKTTLDPMPGLSLGYGGHMLFGYEFTSQKLASRYHMLHVVDFSNNKSYTFTPPSSFDSSTGVFLLPLPTAQ